MTWTRQICLISITVFTALGLGACQKTKSAPPPPTPPPETGLALQFSKSIGILNAGQPVGDPVVVLLRSEFGFAPKKKSYTVKLEAFTDASCSFPSNGTLSTDQASVPALNGDAKFYRVSLSVAGIYYLKASAVGVTPSCSDQITVHSSFASQIILSPAVTAPLAGICAGSFQIQAQDAFHNPSLVENDLNVVLSGKGSGLFYSDSQCMNPTSSVAVQAGTKSASFWYKTNHADSTIFIGNSVLGGSTLPVTTAGSDPVGIVFTNSGSVRSESGACSPAQIKLGFLDTFGNMTTPRIQTDVSVSSSPGLVSYYSDSACLVPVTNFSFVPGQSESSAYFVPAQAGALNLSVSSTGVTSANQSLNVVQGVSISPTSASVVVNSSKVFSTTFGVAPYAYSLTSGAGSVDQAGLFKAPSTTSTSVIRVTDAIAAFREVQIQIIPIPPLTITITPSSLTSAGVADLTISNADGVTCSISTQIGSQMSGDCLKLQAGKNYSSTQKTDQITITDQYGQVVSKSANVLSDPLVLGGGLKDVGVSRASQYGYSVSTYRDIIAVGAPSDSGSFGTYPKCGAVYVYKKTDSALVSLGKVTPGQCRTNLFFGTAVALYAQGWGGGNPNDDYTYLAVGAPGSLGSQGNLVAAGAAYIYRFNTSSASFTNDYQETVLFPSTPVAGAGYGSVLTMAYGVLAVSAPNEGGGSVYSYAPVYDPQSNAWGSEQKLNLGVQASVNDHFGKTLAVSNGAKNNQLLLIGAPGRDSGALSQVGAVFSYQRSAQTWNSRRQLAQSSQVDHSMFGSALSASGPYVAVGAPGESLNQGAVYIYKNVSGYSLELQGAALAELTNEVRIQPSDLTSPALFGSSLTLFGNRLVVGAPGESSIGGFTSQTGRIRVFERTLSQAYSAHDSSSWTQSTVLYPPDYAAKDEHFGAVTALFDGMVVSSAASSDGTGQAYWFKGINWARNKWPFGYDGPLSVTAGATLPAGSYRDYSSLSVSSSGSLSLSSGGNWSIIGSNAPVTIDGVVNANQNDQPGAFTASAPLEDGSLYGDALSYAVNTLPGGGGGIGYTAALRSVSINQPYSFGASDSCTALARPAYQDCYNTGSCFQIPVVTDSVGTPGSNQTLGSGGAGGPGSVAITGATTQGGSGGAAGSNGQGLYIKSPSVSGAGSIQASGQSGKAGGKGVDASTSFCYLYSGAPDKFRDASDGCSGGGGGGSGGLGGVVVFSTSTATSLMTTLSGGSGGIGGQGGAGVSGYWNTIRACDPGSVGQSSSAGSAAQLPF